MTGPLFSSRRDVTIERIFLMDLWRINGDAVRRKTRAFSLNVASGRARSTRLIRLTRGQADYLLGIPHFSLCEEAKNYLTPVAVVRARARAQARSLYLRARAHAVFIRKRLITNTVGERSVIFFVSV